MTFPRTWRVSGMALLAVGSLVAVTTTFVTSASAASSDVIIGTHGVAPRVPLHKAATSTHAPSDRDRGERRAVTGGSAATSSSAPVAKQTSAPPAGTLLQNFNGTSSHDSQVTNFNAEFEPPDQGLCAGNGFVLEPVNSAYNIYRQDGTQIRGPFNVNDIFNEGGEEFTTDPRCHYDPATKRWFASILFLDINTLASSRLDVAVSASDDPTGFWFEYHFDTTNDGTGGTPKHHGCPCLGDQPLLGIDAFNLYVSTNEFSILGNAFNGAQVYAISKSDLVDGGAADFAYFPNLRNGNVRATSLQPAITYGPADAEYLLDSFDSDSTGQATDNRIGVWAMTDQDAVDAGGSPVLSRVVIQSEPYGVPPAAIQKGSRTRIDSGDDRMQQTQFIGGTLWGELGTSLSIPGDTRQRAGAAWFAVKPVLTRAKISSASIQKQGYVADPGSYVLYPAMQANATGSAAMVFTLTGADHFPSAAYAVMKAGATEFGPAVIAAGGTGPYSKGSSRWGDYSWAVLDRPANTVWLATEYIPPKPSQTEDGHNNWGTRVLAARLP